MILEVIARMIVPYAGTQEVNLERNPYYRRGWPEYINRTIKKSENKKKIIIISNSQGYGRETSSDKIYATQLQNKLDLRHPNEYSVLNWSSPGIFCHDIALLLAKAISVDAEKIILPITPFNFHTYDDQDVEYSNLDLPLIISDLKVRNILGNKFCDSYVNYESITQSYFSKLYLVRIKKHLKDYLVRNEKETYQFLQSERTFNLPPRHSDKTYTIGPSYDSYYTEYIADILERNKHSEVYFSVCPLKYESLNANSKKMIKDFEEIDLNLLRQNSKVKTNNFSESLDYSKYYHSAHYDYNNHEAFAEVLLRTIM